MLYGLGTVHAVALRTARMYKTGYVHSKNKMTTQEAETISGCGSRQYGGNAITTQHRTPRHVSHVCPLVKGLPTKKKVAAWEREEDKCQNVGSRNGTTRYMCRDGQKGKGE